MCVRYGNIKEEADRYDLTGKQRICKLSAWGFPVYENNAGLWVDYFHWFLQINKNVLKPSCLCSTNGWKEIDGDKFFVWGNRCFPVNPQKKINVKLVPSSPGFHSLVKSIRVEGKFSEWDAMADAMMRDHAIPAFCLIAGFTPPLLELMDQDNFSIDIYGITTSGKTTTHLIVASIYFRPSDALITNFTSVGAEEAISFFNGMPSFIQDTHKIRNRRHIEDISYMVSDGRGRLRGAKAGGIRS